MGVGLRFIGPQLSLSRNSSLLRISSQRPLFGNERKGRRIWRVSPQDSACSRGTTYNGSSVDDLWTLDTQIIDALSNSHALADRGIWGFAEASK